MIALTQRRLGELIRDPALLVIAGCLLTIGFLVLRLEPLDLKNAGQMSGLDLLFSDLLRTSTGSPVVAYGHGLLLLIALCWPVVCAVLPQMLEVPAMVQDRARGLAVRAEILIVCSLVLGGLLLLLLLPLLRLTQMRPWELEASLYLGIIVLAQCYAIGLWASLWVTPSPARLWQRLAVMLGPVYWSGYLICSGPVSLPGQPEHPATGWLLLVGLLALGLSVKVRLWDRLPTAATFSY